MIISSGRFLLDHLRFPESKLRSSADRGCECLIVLPGGTNKTFVEKDFHEAMEARYFQIHPFHYREI